MAQLFTEGQWSPSLCFSHLPVHPNYLEGVFKHRQLGSSSRMFDSLGLGWAWGFAFLMSSNKTSSVADAASLETRPLLKSYSYCRRREKSRRWLCSESWEDQVSPLLNLCPGPSARLPYLWQPPRIPRQCLMAFTGESMSRSPKPPDMELTSLNHQKLNPGNFKGKSSSFLLLPSPWH